VVRLLGSLFLFSLALIASFADLNGTWIGTFNGQPQELLPDGSYPETVTRFKLALKTQGSRVTGTFSNLDEVPRRTQPVQHARRIDDMFCFDVFDAGNDHRWCVRARGVDLEGTWSGGPAGGGGLGVGSRLFDVRAKRATRP
jgi:hypothetical protein